MDQRSTIETSGRLAACLAIAALAGVSPARGDEQGSAGGAKAAKAPPKAAKADGKASKPDGNSARTDRKAGPVDCSFSLPSRRPLLCTRIASLKGEMAQGGRAGGQKVSIDMGDLLSWVDEHQSIDPAAEEATRTFLTAASTMNGETDDSPLAGVTVAYSRKGEQVQAALKGNRRLTQKRINDLLRESGSVGLWV